MDPLTILLTEAATLQHLLGRNYLSTCDILQYNYKALEAYTDENLCHSLIQ